MLNVGSQLNAAELAQVRRGELTDLWTLPTSAEVAKALRRLKNRNAPKLIPVTNSCPSFSLSLAQRHLWQLHQARYWHQRSLAEILKAGHRAVKFTGMIADLFHTI